MKVANTELLCYLTDLLQPDKIRDYCPNGMQVEGKQSIGKVVTGVTASQALIDAAIDVQADAILVHHGYFWQGEAPCIQGMKRHRLKALLQHDINLFAYHLPLDVHPLLGNNAQLASMLEIDVEGGLERDNLNSVPQRGRLATPCSLAQFAARVEAQLDRKPLLQGPMDKLISTVGWCSGGGQSYIELAAQQGLDLYLSGEVSEPTIHIARETNTAFIAAGHHATERYGVKALGEHLAAEFNLDVEFIDIDNPV